MNAMLISACAPPNMWGEAILSTRHIQNGIILRKLVKHLLSQSECLAKVLLREPKKRKIGSKNCDCMFIGYAENSATYRFMVLRSDMLDINKIIESKNA